MVVEHSNNEPRSSAGPAGDGGSDRETDSSQVASPEQNAAPDAPNEDTQDKASREGSEEGAKRLYKTGEVLTQSGISRQMLYRYIQMDLVVPAETTKTGRNLFSDSVFKQIKMIQQLNERYTLQNIREIFSHRLRQL